MKLEDLEEIRRVAEEVKKWPEWKRKDQGFKGPDYATTEKCLDEKMEEE